MAQSTHKNLKGKERLFIIDEVSQPKKGDKSIGVARQHCGNRGKVENCQVSVCGYLTDFHQGSLIDVRLDDTFGFLCRLFDNLEAKMADYTKYDHHFR